MNPQMLQLDWWTLLLTGLLLQLIILPIRSLGRFHWFFGAFLSGLYFVMIPLSFILGYRVGASLIMSLPLLYLLVNAFRLSLSRFNQDYQRSSVLKSTIWLTIMALTSSVLGWYSDRRIWGVLLAVILVSNMLGSIYILLRALWVDRHYRMGLVKPSYRASKLPAVTLAIPARNETNALREALQGAISSDYPKLEILVLDDCSQDRTAQVIRSFAHQGVRFVQGEVPAEGWLGKNRACELLANEASGDVIIFASVDTHFGPQTVSNLVAYMSQTKAEMVSVLPRRRGLDVIPVFLSPLRDFWQVMLPLRSGQVPVASQCWVIRRNILLKDGGFAGVRGSVFPEEHFARRSFKKNRYRFVIADRWLELTTRKRLSSQIETSTRTYYPLLKRRPSRVAMMTILIGLVLVQYAYVSWEALFAFNLYPSQAVATLSIACLTVGYLLVLRRTTPRAWLIGLINLPFVFVFDLLLFNWSMLAFEFGEVNWKGRNVCYPVIEAIPQGEFTKLVG